LARNRRLLVAVACGVFLLLFLRRALLVSFLALKLAGYPAALDSWKGAVHHRSVEHAGIPIDIYGDDAFPSALLIVHGVNPTGKNSLDLVRIADGLAQSGFEVYVPDFAEMRKVHLTPAESLNIRNTFELIGRDAGIACFSYGCGPAMAAAADADIRDHVRFILAFGGYFDIREALEFLVTGPEPPVAYAKWAYLTANPDLAADEIGRERIARLFAAQTPGEFRARFSDLPHSTQARLAALSPATFLAQLKAPLILVHGMDDPVIPSSQSVEFDRAARAKGLNSSVTLLRMYGHVNPVRPGFDVSSLIGFYLPDAFRLLRVVNRLVGYS
jgi:pimeloyl-ACP methyl ester carboxylesterase